MNRDTMLQALEAARVPWDIVVIGGGAAGLGVAVDAAARGYHTALFERADFAAGASGRSAGLLHTGAPRPNHARVGEALAEWGRLRDNAPHLVEDLPLLAPQYEGIEGPFTGIGRRMYDHFAELREIGASEWLSAEETAARLPGIERAHLLGGLAYTDGRFEDARLAIALARTAAGRGTVLLNHAGVVALRYDGDIVSGVTVRDEETGQTLHVSARAVVNAAGTAADAVRRLDTAEAPPVVAQERVLHLVLDRGFLPGDTAFRIAEAEGVLFAAPWRDAIVVGAETSSASDAGREVQPGESEALLDRAARYLSRRPTLSDVRSAFVGLRPVASNAPTGLAPSHAVLVAASGLVTVAGGSWSTYRAMAADAVDRAALVAGLPERPAPTARLPLHGHYAHADVFGTLALYGSDAPGVQSLTREFPALSDRLHPDRPELAAEVVWAIQNEMARTVEDVLARRTRALLLDTRASLAMAPRVAALLAEHLGRDDAWAEAQVEAYRETARGFLPPEA